MVDLIRRVSVSPRILLVIGVFISALIAWLDYSASLERAEDKFREDANARLSAITNTMQAEASSPRVLESFYVSSSHVNGGEFATFQSVLTETHSSLLSTFIFEFVDREKLDEWTADELERGGHAQADFRVHNPVGDELPDYDELMVLSRLWSPDMETLALGGEYSHIEDLRDFLQLARTADIAQASQLVKQVFGVSHNNPLMLLALPVYSSNEDTSQPADKVAVFFYDINDLITASVGDLNNQGVEIYIRSPNYEYALEVGLNGRRVPAFSMYAGADDELQFLEKFDPPADGVYSSDIDFGSDKLSVYIVKAKGHYEGAVLISAMLFAAGLFATILLSRATQNLIESRNAVQKEVEIKTRDLVGAYEILERQQNDLLSANKDLEAAMQAAQTANKAKSQFLANMSHELRTPLNAVIGYSEMLLDDAEDDENERLANDLHKILGAGRNLLGLINDILDLSRIEAERMNLVIDEFHVEDMINGIVSTVGPLIAKNDNHFHVDCSPRIAEIETDEQRLRQILFNLISNAAKFTSQGSVRLTADLDSTTGNIIFKVMDTGIGMTEAQMAHIFDAFTQADASTTRLYGGSGLGLAISSEFCELLGGSISVESRKGQGSTFVVTMPQRFSETQEGESSAPQAALDNMIGTAGQAQDEIAAEDSTVDDPPYAIAEEPAPEPFPATDAEVADEPPMEDLRDAVDIVAAQSVSGLGTKGEKYRILVIDDEKDAREITSRYLSDKASAIFEADSGEKGIEMAREHRPDIIVLDIMMPGLNGWAVLEILKADPDLSNIPVVVCTMVDDAVRGFVLGASDFIQKPVNRNDLLSRISNCLGDVDDVSVLVVEDEDNIRHMMERMLVKAGFKTYTATNGAEAFDVLKTSTPSVILLDLMMPVMDGFQFMRKFEKTPLFNKVPVIIVTAKEMSTSERMKLNSRVETIIRKGDYTREQLLAQIDQLATRAINLRRAKDKHQVG